MVVLYVKSLFRWINVLIDEAELMMVSPTGETACVGLQLNFLSLELAGKEFILKVTSLDC